VQQPAAVGVPAANGMDPPQELLLRGRTTLALAAGPATVWHQGEHESGLRRLCAAALGGKSLAGQQAEHEYPGSYLASHVRVAPPELLAGLGFRNGPRCR